MNMGQRIKQRLTKLNWTQAVLVEKIPELSRGALSALIQRNSRVSVFSERIAEVLGVNHRWLTDGEGPEDLSFSVNPQFNLSPRQQSIVELMRCLTEMQQDELIRTAQRWADSNQAIIRELTQQPSHPPKPKPYDNA